MMEDAAAAWSVRSVVFDLDGLLVDTEPIFAEAARQLLEARGLKLVPEVLRGMMGTPARQALAVFRSHYSLPEADADLLVEAMRRFTAILGGRPAPLLPGALDLLNRLQRRGIPLAIATSSGPEYVRQILMPHGIRDRFAFILTCDDVARGKPFPEVYEKAAARFGLPPASMVVLEDSPNGLRAAKAAGARCVVVPHGLVQLEDLDGADAIVTSLADRRLLELLGLQS